MGLFLYDVNPSFKICEVLDNECYKKVETLREDCRSLHAEPLHQGAELPRQAVVQKGLSTFRKAFTLTSLADSNLEEACGSTMVYALYGLSAEEIAIVEGSGK